MEKKHYLDPSQMYMLHSICREFAHVIQKEKDEKEYNLEEESINKGLDLGIRSCVMLFNSFLIDKEGKINESELTRMVKSFANKHQGKTEMKSKDN